MKKISFIVFLVGTFFVGFAQKNSAKLFKITKNNQSVTVGNYKKMFKPSVAIINRNEDFKQNLQLLVDYHLKLIKATELGLDKNPEINKEILNYKNDLATPFLMDTITLEKLMREAYDRTKYIVKCSHILIGLGADKDTVKPYQKIKEIRNKILNGADFNKMALEFSEDPSAKQNQGELGYFTPFKMVYAFETAAYNTPVGKVSNIVKTRFGYHLIKVEDKIKSDGKVDVAHIMTIGLTEDKKQKIDSIYKAILAGKSFEEMAKNFSEDKGSKYNAGRLKPFDKGMLPPAFEEVAFSLKEKGAISAPFKTSYGWHIVKFYNKLPVPTYEESAELLRREIIKDDRGEIAKNLAYQKIAKTFHLKVDEEALKIFEREDIYNLPADSLQQVLMQLGDVKILQAEFGEYIKHRRTDLPIGYFEEFKEKKLKEHFVAHLESVSKEYQDLLQNYKEGLMIFELTKQNVWDIAEKNTDAVKAFYEANKAKYQEKGSEFEQIKGYVQSDYQDELQQKWSASLRAEYPIRYYNKNVQKLEKSLNK